MNFDVAAADDAVDNLDLARSVELENLFGNDDGDRSSSGMTVVGMSVVCIS